MSSSKFAKGLTLEIPFAPSLPASFLNAYSILNPAWLSWSVNIYNVELFGSEAQGHERRGEIRGAMWEAWREYKGRCKGLPFVIDVNSNLVAVPGNWDLPPLITTKDFAIRFEKSITARPSDKESRGIVEGIFREALKLHFSKNRCPELGDLWKDYNSFCQYPTPQSSDGYNLLVVGSASGRRYSREVSGLSALPSAQPYWTRGQSQITTQSERSLSPRR